MLADKRKILYNIPNLFFHKTLAIISTAKYFTNSNNHLTKLMETFEKQFQRIKEDAGFIAALDQSGGSTPKALQAYGIADSSYNGEEEMFNLIHEMRSRVISDRSFTGDKILGVILFERTFNSSIEGIPTAEFLWKKNIVPFLKIDKGLDEKANGVKVMKPIPNLDERLKNAKSRGIFGTKMRSVIYEKNAQGIEAIVAQQFDFGKMIMANGLVPIIEPEVDIHADDKQEIETLLKAQIIKQLDQLDAGQKILLKLTLPSRDNFYTDLIEHPNVARVFALSGGYSLEEATDLLSKNNGMIASFSRALLNGLKVDQTSEEFSTELATAIDSIYKASIT